MGKVGSPMAGGELTSHQVSIMLRHVSGKEAIANAVARGSKNDEVSSKVAELFELLTNYVLISFRVRY